MKVKTERAGIGTGRKQKVERKVKELKREKENQSDGQRVRE